MSEKIPSPAPKANDPQNPVLHGKATPGEVPEVRQFLTQYAPRILTAVIAVLVVTIAVNYYRNYQQSSRVRAAQLLAEARSTESIRYVIDKYGSTPIVPLARLALGSEYFMNGQYDLARAAYADFLQHHPRHPLRDFAELDQITCQEAAGQSDPALAAYQRFATTHTNTFLQPLALFGQARILEQLGRHDAARAIYEDFITAHPDSEWRSLAESGRRYTEQCKRAAAAGIRYTTPPPPLAMPRTTAGQALSVPVPVGPAPDIKPAASNALPAAGMK